jgi:hypothetical protein
MIFVISLFLHFSPNVFPRLARQFALRTFVHAATACRVLFSNLSALPRLDPAKFSMLDSAGELILIQFSSGVRPTRPGLNYNHRRHEMASVFSLGLPRLWANRIYPKF